MSDKEIISRQHLWHRRYPEGVTADDLWSVEVFCKVCFTPASVSHLYVDPTDMTLARKIQPPRPGGLMPPVFCSGPP